MQEVRRTMKRCMVGALHRCGWRVQFFILLIRSEEMLTTLSSLARETFTLRWRPHGDTAVALLTAVLMVGLYYVNSRA